MARDEILLFQEHKALTLVSARFWEVSFSGMPLLRETSLAKQNTTQGI